MSVLLRKLLGLSIIIASFGIGWLLMDLQHYVETPIPGLDRSLRYTLAPGMGLHAMVRTLHRQGVITHPDYLMWYARWQGRANHIEVGEYEFPPGSTPAQMLDKLFKGDVIQYALTIPEGWTFQQMLRALNQQDKLQHLVTGLSDEQIMVKLGHAREHPEGRFYPDTYHFTRNTRDLSLLKQAYQSMAERLDREWQQRATGLPYHDPYEALIMASIIEKETAIPDERKKIAGVFVRRLQKHMRLQTDPTVIYGLGNRYHGNLRRRDLKAPSPYNTYLQRGLPPTPIALPGGDALHAALHPAAGKALYFVARGDGSHQFSATIGEHNAAVRKYQLRAHYGQ